MQLLIDLAPVVGGALNVLAALVRLLAQLMGKRSCGIPRTPARVDLDDVTDVDRAATSARGERRHADDGGWGGGKRTSRR
jgi:hypothetical protein